VAVDDVAVVGERAAEIGVAKNAITRE